MNAVQFLRDCKTFYVATIDGDQPRVRPFGAVAEFEGKLYLCTANTKDCFAQMKANPKIEISGYIGTEWIRLTAEAIEDDRREARLAMLEQNPSLNNMYSADDGKFAVLYLKNCVGRIDSFVKESEILHF